VTADLMGQSARTQCHSSASQPCQHFLSRRSLLASLTFVAANLKEERANAVSVRLQQAFNEAFAVQGDFPVSSLLGVFERKRDLDLGELRSKLMYACHVRNECILDSRCPGTLVGYHDVEHGSREQFVDSLGTGAGS
jgi:hypothetical protein